MPLTFTVSEGGLPEGQETIAFQRLTDVMLKLHGLSGNAFMTPNVVGSIHILPRGRSFSGNKEIAVAFIEWKVPSFAFTDRDLQLRYVAEATDIVHDLSNGRLPKEHIWVNVSHAVDGAWGIAGHAYTNGELGEAVARGIPAKAK